MFSLHITNSIITLQLLGVIPGLSIVIKVEAPSTGTPVKVDLKIDGQVKP